MTKPTPGPWRFHEKSGMVQGEHSTYGISVVGPPHWVVPPLNINPADVRIMAASLDLLLDAQAMHCLATSPRFQRMTVADAIAEMGANGMGYSRGAAIAKATGEQK